MRQLQKSHDRMIAGVAAGLAEYFEMDKTLWRAIWVVGCIVVPPAILAYLILAIIVPQPPLNPARPQAQPEHQAGPVAPEAEATRTEPQFAAGPTAQPGPDAQAGTQPRRKQMTKSHDRWLAGVAGGIADYFDVDPVLIRALFLAAFLLGGSGLLIYIILAILMPKPQYQYQYR